MDLNTLDFAAHAAKGVEIEIVHPVTGKGVGFFLTVIGRDSDEYRQRVFAKTQELLDESTRTPRRGAKRSAKEDVSKTAEQMFEDQVDDIAFMVRGWRTEVRTAPDVVTSHDGVAILNGAELPFTPDNVRMVLRRFAPVMEQTGEAVKSRALFMPESANS